jgi:hypothetical protein
VTTCQTGTLLEHDERTLRLERSDGTTQVVIADPAVWEELACRIAGRSLTEREWRELIGTNPYAPACRN